MAENIIEVRSLTKEYKDGASKVFALDDVSFSLKKGESLAVVGPSGSGKTTLLEIMAGLNKPTKGDVIINGKNVHRGSDSNISKFRNKTVGFVFQMMHLQDYLNALENVTIPLIAAGVPSNKAIEKAKNLLTKVGLEDRMKHYPKQLSGGEMQRVAVARALINDPEIIFADEPTGKLDRANADKLLDIFEQIMEDGVSVVMITHDEKIASKFKNKIYLEHGRKK